jgi:hypothetical protein
MVEILKFLDADVDPGSGNLFDPESGIRDKKFGSGINGYGTTTSIFILSRCAEAPISGTFIDDSWKKSNFLRRAW